MISIVFNTITFLKFLSCQFILAFIFDIQEYLFWYYFCIILNLRVCGKCLSRTWMKMLPIFVFNYFCAPSFFSCVSCFVASFIDVILIASPLFKDSFLVSLWFIKYIPRWLECFLHQCQNLLDHRWRMCRLSINIFYLNI